MSKPLDYVVIPQNKPSLLGSNMQSDCTTDASQLNQSPNGSMVHMNDAHVLGFSSSLFITPSSSEKEDEMASQSRCPHSEEPKTIAAFSTDNTGVPAQRQDFATSMLDALPSRAQIDSSSIFAMPPQSESSP